MKKIPYIYVCLGILLSAFQVQAAPEAVFNKLAKTYTLHADGSQEMRVYKELTLFTHTAMNGLYGESFIVYNPAYQELKIHQSCTRQKDGTLIQTPENAFVEVLPAAAADAPAYNGWKEMVVVHTGLELGATLYLDYSVITRPGYLPALDVCTQVEEQSPIKEYVCTVSVPEGRPLNHVLVNGKARPVVKQAGGYQTVTWTLKNVPAYNPTEAYPALAGNVQQILANTYASAADALHVLNRQFTASQEPEVLALAQQLTASKPAKEKEAALKAYVQSLGTCRLALADAGYRIRPAKEVIRTAYGTQAEKMNLLAGLMQAAGVPAEVKVAYAVKADERNLGLSAVSNLFVESSAAAELQDFQPVLNLQGAPVALAKKAPIVRQDTLTVTPETGKTLAGGYQLVTLPRAAEGIAAYRYGHRESNCSGNLLLPVQADETYTCVVNLPNDRQLCTPASTREIANRVGTYTLTVKDVDGRVEVSRSLRLNMQLITPAEYADFRQLMAEWEAPHTTTLLLKSK